MNGINGNSLNEKLYGDDSQRRSDRSSRGRDRGGNNLPSGAPTVTKKIISIRGISIPAKRKVFTPDQLGTIKIHPLNRRAQEFLDEIAVADVIEETKELGFILQEALLIEKNSSFDALDGSRRLFSAKFMSVDYPAWVISQEDLDANGITDQDLKALVGTTERSRSPSLYEAGVSLSSEVAAIRAERGLTDHKLYMYLSETYGLSREYYRVACKSAQVPEKILKLFIDPMIMKTTTYKKLVSVWDKLSTQKDINIDALVGTISSKLNDDRKSIKSDVESLGIEVSGKRITGFNNQVIRLLDNANNSGDAPIGAKWDDMEIVFANGSETGGASISSIKQKNDEIKISLKLDSVRQERLKKLLEDGTFLNFIVDDLD